MKGLILAVLVIFASGGTIHAQAGRPAPVMEAGFGWAGFADNAIVDHGATSVAGRVYVTPRVSLGPELVFMKGPGTDRDLMVTGNITFDVRRPAGTVTSRVTPFLVAGGGYFRNSSSVGSRQFSSSEGSFTAGGGIRVGVSDRIYAAADARVGWELHLRISGVVGYRFGR